MKAQTKAQSFSISKLDVSSSSMKVWLFLAILSLAHLFIGYQLGGRLGLFIGLLLAVVFNFLLFTYTDNRLLNFFNAEEILGRDSWKLLDRAKIFARNAGMEKPKIFVAEHPTPFAFSLAHLGRNGSVCLSSSLLNKLDDIEVSAVLAHQICKISTLQSLSSGAASSVANAFLGLAYTLDQFPPIRLAKPFTRMISPVAWLLIRAFMPERKFHENDDQASSMVEDRYPLANALWKIESYCETMPFQTLPCTEHLFIVSPKGSHRLTESRIRRLAGTFPL
jgi:heat shock protein HtpX